MAPWRVASTRLAAGAGALAVAETVAIIDWETRAARNLKKTGVEAYTECPHFAVSCLAWCYDRGDGVNLPVHGVQFIRGREVQGDHGHNESLAELQGLFDHVAAGRPVVAHNARFELSVWREMSRREGWPELRVSQLHDTMALARAIAMPAALADLAPALKLSIEKDLAGHSLMLKLCKPRKPRKGEPKDAILWHEDVADLAGQFEYCKRDVETERDVWRKLPPLRPEERETWELDQAINDAGVYVDVEAARNCLRIVNDEQARLNAELWRLTDGYVKTARSGQALLNWLASYGVALPDLRKGTVDAALKRMDLEPTIRRALEIRAEANKASTAKIEALLHGVCRDGRMRGLLGYHGAATGRWVGHRFQPQNMVRTPETFGETEAEDVFAWAAAAQSAQF